MKEATPAWPSPLSPFAGSDWFDPLEEAVRGQVRAFIEQLLEEELEAALGRGRYERGASSNGRRHGHRPRQLVTTFGPLTLSVPRARLPDDAGEREWKSALLPAYQRLSRRAEALIAEAYLAGVNTRRVRRALAKLFEVMSIPLEDIFAQNAKMYEGESRPDDLERHADEWLTANAEPVDGWLSVATAAAANFRHRRWRRSLEADAATADRTARFR